MRVSIITPSYNQAAFLEETMLSVLNQTYPDIEYIVVDGGSTDGSVEIIRKYTDRLAHWESRKDKGLYDAVNQGWSRATGEILSYLNSDDVLVSNAVETVVDLFSKNPEVDVLYGDAKVIDEKGGFLYDFPSRKLDLTTVFKTWEDPIRQPSAFVRRRVFERFGGFDDSYHFCGDFHYWIHISGGVNFLHVPVVLSYARLHAHSKTSTILDTAAAELIRLCKTSLEMPVFRSSGVAPKEALQGAYYRASQNFRNSGAKSRAIRAYFLYCANAFSPPKAFYRFCRYVAGMLWRRR